MFYVNITLLNYGFENDYPRLLQRMAVMSNTFRLVCMWLLLTCYITLQVCNVRGIHKNENEIFHFILCNQ